LGGHLPCRSGFRNGAVTTGLEEAHGPAEPDDGGCMTEEGKGKRPGVIERIEARADPGAPAVSEQLYDADIVAWSERQGELLRRKGAGKQVNEADMDWENLAEEIEDVGRSEWHAVESLLTQALLHMLKAQAWPLMRDVPSWQADARLFRRQARRRFVPSMRQKIDVASLYADALAGLPETMEGQAALPVPPDCPVTLDELLGEA
jgi:hypothetical protein